jgi:hypothetical protein
MAKYQPNSYWLSGIVDLLVISHKQTWFSKNSIRYEGLSVYMGIDYERFNCTYKGKMMNIYGNKLQNCLSKENAESLCNRDLP